MSKIKFFNLFKRNIEGKTLRVDRSNQSYSYFRNECKGHYTMSRDGILVSIDDERERLVRERVILDRLIKRSDDAYLFFKDEYRQNGMMEDHFGNVLLSDDAVGIRR